MVLVWAAALGGCDAIAKTLGDAGFRGARNCKVFLDRNAIVTQYTLRNAKATVRIEAVSTKESTTYSAAAFVHDILVASAGGDDLAEVLKDLKAEAERWAERLVNVANALLAGAEAAAKKVVQSINESIGGQERATYLAIVADAQTKVREAVASLADGVRDLMDMMSLGDSNASKMADLLALD